MRFGSVLLLLLTCAVGLAQSPWRVVEIPGLSNPFFERIRFGDDRIGWMLTNPNQFLKTHDGGKTWMTVRVELAQPDVEFHSLWFVDEKQGWAAGATNYQPAIWHTSDGGKSWTLDQLWPPLSENWTGDMSDITFADGAHGWAVGHSGHNGMIVATTDGGHHWKVQYYGGEITARFEEVRCTDKSSCWVLGQDGIMLTEDGGEWWHLAYFGGFLKDIDVVDTANLWLAGSRGHLVHATHGGRIWQDVPIAGLEHKEFSHVRFVNAHLGWATTTEDQILMTRDGGRTWVREVIPTRPKLRLAAMAATSSTLFVIANPGHLLTRPLH